MTQSQVLDATGELQASLRGQVFAAGDAAYEEARSVFNAMIDARPAVIVRCAGAADVLDAVAHARERELEVAVRGGGHSVAGKSVCDGGLVIDLSAMRGVRVDPVRRTARAEPGLRLGDLDHETQAFGLATPLGIVTDTGIAGLTLGGGIGWLNGLHGLACDNVISADVVTADGRLLTASAEENADLYWGLRGGSGNFGVVTSFEYRLHPVGPVLGGLVLYPIEQAGRVLAGYAEHVASCPDELSTVAALLSGPDGSPLVAVGLCHAGSLEAGVQAAAPYRSLGEPVADIVRPLPYTEMQRLLDGGWPAGRHHYWKSSFLRRLSAAAIEAMGEAIVTAPSPHSVIVMQHVHGAAARVDATATAFPHRADQWDFGIYAMWTDPAATDENVAWARRWWAAIEPFLETGVYSNNLGEEGADRVRAAYGANYERLVEVKNRYDPHNLFRRNQNVEPAAQAGTSHSS